MSCKRCRGLMVSDAFIDLDDDSGHLWLGVWRCVNCGEVVDLGIARNRLREGSVWSGVTRLVGRITSRRSIPRRYQAMPLSA